MVFSQFHRACVLSATSFDRHGHRRHPSPACSWSPPALNADIAATVSEVSYGPEADNLFNHHPYSITSSARSSSDSGIVKPIALAVLLLMRSSNLVGCSTGKSAGFSPLRILSTYTAARRKILR